MPPSRGSSSPGSTATAPPRTADAEPRLPSLFARETHLLGWQGLTATIPVEWNLAYFGGNYENGHLRADDDDGPRLELRWEHHPRDVDLARSVSGFIDRIGKQMKKAGEAFQPEENLRALNKARPRTARKGALHHFAWRGERDSVQGQGCGAVWQCAVCGRVVVAHVIGRGNERAERVQRLATEILSSIHCHGSGGWQTWSVFDLRLEMPEEFALSSARLMTGRIELEWLRIKKGGILRSRVRDQRIRLARFALADVVLRAEPFADWLRRVPLAGDKLYVWRRPTACTVEDHAALRATGALRDWRKQLYGGAKKRLLRRAGPEIAMLAWHCAPANKLFVLTSDLSPQNAHVAGDVYDALQCH